MRSCKNGVHDRPPFREGGADALKPCTPLSWDMESFPCMAVGAGRRFRLDLQRLAGMVGRRNAHLLALCNRGVNAGLPDEEIERRIIEASGDPPLSVEEVRRAIAKAHTNRSEVEGVKHSSNAAGHGEKAAHTIEPAFPPQKGIVRRMIEAGHGTWDDLVSLSPMRLPDGEDDASRLERATLALRTLYRPSERLCLGGLHSTDATPLEDWLEILRSIPACYWPERMGANPFTGARCKANVAAWRYALLEFDHLPLEEQRDFWIGIIKRQALPVAAITHSGNKSLHGLVRVDARTEAEYSRAWSKLESFFASPHDPEEERFDTSCGDGSRLTRLPEGNNVKTGGVQRLLYLA